MITDEANDCSPTLVLRTPKHSQSTSFLHAVPGFCAAWLLLVLPAYAAHSFEGFLSFETYDRSSAVDFVRTVAFTLEVENSKRWMIKCVADVAASSARSSPKPERTVFKKDDQDLYVLTDFPDRQRTVDEKRSPITRNIEIYREDFPPQDAFYTAALWLAYCAPLPLTEVTPGRLRPVLNMNYDLARDAAMLYSQELSHGGRVLQSLVFAETSADSLHQWRAVHLRASAIDFIDPFPYIAEFQVTMYRAQLASDGILQEVPIAIIKGTCQRATKLTKPIAFPPLDERGPSVVTDDRLRRSGITNVTYLATNRIPLPAESQDLRQRYEGQILRERRFQEAANRQARSRAKAWATLLTVLAVAPTIAFMVWRRKGSPSRGKLHPGPVSI